MVSSFGEAKTTASRRTVSHAAHRTGSSARHDLRNSEISEEPASALSRQSPEDTHPDSPAFDPAQYRRTHRNTSKPSTKEFQHIRA